jgi:hypothetical protein
LRRRLIRKGWKLCHRRDQTRGEDQVAFLSPVPLVVLARSPHQSPGGLHACENFTQTTSPACSRSQR